MTEVATDPVAFREDGYLHLPELFSPAEVAELRTAIDAAAEVRAGSSSLDDGAMTFYSLLFPLSVELQASANLAASPPSRSSSLETEESEH